jgi:hypothetical protein
MFRSVIFQGEHVSLQPWYHKPHILVNIHPDTGMLYLSNRFRADSLLFTFFQGVDFVVDGGERLAYPSTVVDMTGQKPTLLRRGKGLVEDWMLMEAHDSTEATGVDGLANPYAYTAPAPF